MYSLGIDIGGTKCAVILGKGSMPDDPKELIVDRISFPTGRERGYNEVIKDIISSADEIMRRNETDAGRLIGIGISCGGPLDSKKGTINCPPNLPDWDNVPICDIFTEKFGVPVFLQNDANACAAAEWKFGAGRGCDNMVFLTFGTGMGAGLILNGRLYSGTNDMAGEVGHIRLEKDGPVGYGKSGSFEGFCSGGGIARLSRIMA
ncbi:MAG: ROK family protein, partial [Clostridiales bacterium]|nr:ROK family protein [Clostridiales bacterium]